MSRKPRLLVLSHVLPFPGTCGQQLRVLYTLRAARECFHVTFATSVANGMGKKIGRELAALCDEVVLLPSQYSRGAIAKSWHRARGLMYQLRTGLKFSNYVLGRLEFTPGRVASLARQTQFDCVLLEYWHAAGSMQVLRQKGIRCVLDMHDVLWRSYAEQLRRQRALPAWWKGWAVDKYRHCEESAWARFDGVITINRAEHQYVQERVPPSTRLFFAPMGIDLAAWSYAWQPSEPPRLAYYGALGSAHNEQAALTCHAQIMPIVWAKHPEAELWLVGSHPSQRLRALTADPRVKVSGYVEEVQLLLSTMSAVMCPWSGRYGFRSRLVEVMALGIPVVASFDAVYGMELEDGKGVLLSDSAEELAGAAVRLLDDVAFAREQSRFAREQVERVFSMDRTYGQLVQQLSAWL